MNCYLPATFQPNFSSKQNQDVSNLLSFPSFELLNNKIKNINNSLIPPKLYKKSSVIISANIPLSMKYNLIQSILNDQCNLKDNHNKSFTSRKIFKKEEDEKIKQLVEIFGSSNWDLISYFIDGRTAKQCRDRYSNYLAPGFFQGEWSEEDSLLIKLYNENGPKWSVIQKSFPNRSSNNIKNRWKYFIYQNIKISKDRNQKEIKKNNEKSLLLNQKLEFPNNINSKTEDNVQLDSLFNDDNQAFFQQENDFYDPFSNIENDNDIPFY